MQCPCCAAEIQSDAMVCPSCGATRLTGRSRTGVIVGMLGVVGIVLWGILWVLLLALLLVGQDVTGFPWPALIVGTIVTAGLLWYSRTTVQTRWTPPENNRQP